MSFGQLDGLANDDAGTLIPVGAGAMTNSDNSQVALLTGVLAKLSSRTKTRVPRHTPQEHAAHDELVDTVLAEVPAEVFALLEGARFEGNDEFLKYKLATGVVTQHAREAELDISRVIHAMEYLPNRIEIIVKRLKEMQANGHVHLEGIEQLLTAASEDAFRMDRNGECPCCDSGAKAKNCCGKVLRRGFKQEEWNSWREMKNSQ